MEAKPLIIFGAGLKARRAIEIFVACGREIYGLLDDNTPANTLIDDLPVLGTTDDEGFLKLIGHKCDAFVAVENAREQKQLTTYLMDKRHVMPVNAIHPRAWVSPGAVLGYGSYIGANAVVEQGAYIGQHTYIGSGAVVCAGAVFADYVHIGEGALVDTEAVIGEAAYIGAGSRVLSTVSVGPGASVGAGSVVMAPVGKGERVFGVPAEKV